MMAPVPLSPSEIVDEVTHLWLPNLAERDWVARWRTMRQIVDQLQDDIPDADAARSVAGRVVAELIGGFSDPQPVRSEVQALVYALSADPDHRAAAEDWFKRPSPPEPVSELRAAPRRLIDEEGDMTVGHRRVPCTVIDLSRTGALVECRHQLSPGMNVLLSWDDTAGRHRSVRAEIVRANPDFVGLKFTRPQQVPVRV